MSVASQWIALPLLHQILLGKYVAIGPGGIVVNDQMVSEAYALTKIIESCSSPRTVQSVRVIVLLKGLPLSTGDFAKYGFLAECEKTSRRIAESV